MSRTPLEAAEQKEHNKNKLSRGWEIKVLGWSALPLSPAVADPPPREGRWRAAWDYRPPPLFARGRAYEVGERAHATDFNLGSSRRC
jgi:hypothetical protein